jgi:glycogen debranching enzyme
VNFGNRDVIVPLAYDIGADFVDIFEVRGMTRARRGRMLPTIVEADSISFRYAGLDDVVRQTTIAFSTKPDKISENRAETTIRLPAGGKIELYAEIGVDPSERPGRKRFRIATARARLAVRERLRRGARLRASDGQFTEWISKSASDLALLTTDLATGPYPYAGLPWFSTTFGRDAIVTALQTLWLDPALARGVLRYLAQTQARETSTFSDSAPGKILHEMRQGEMATLGEIPFRRYYGGVDTTPLFIVLACAYADRTGDLELIGELWPHLVAAIAWIEGVAKTDPDGFLVYARGEKTGLANQGWKDSEDSIFHADGTMATGPIALVEVQGYVFRALLGLSSLLERRGDSPGAKDMRIKAAALRERAEKCFWMPDAKFYGIARDGQGRLCRVRASNPGHLLYMGLPSGERARAVTRQILSADFDTGWGTRTLALHEANFNPMSYHNGSVWPHDSAICAAGLAQYGERAGVVRLASELFDAASRFDLRLPELYCGFVRKIGEPPVGYPVACLPQAWSAGAVFMMVQACLGLTIDGWRSEVHIRQPELPAHVDRLLLRGLRVGAQEVDIAFERHERRVVAFPVGGSRDIPIILHEE